MWNRNWMRVVFALACVAAVQAQPTLPSTCQDQLTCRGFVLDLSVESEFSAMIIASILRVCHSVCAESNLACATLFALSLVVPA